MILIHKVKIWSNLPFILVGADFVDRSWVCTGSSPHQAICIRVLQPPLRVALHVQIVEMDLLSRQRSICFISHDSPQPFHGACRCRTRPCSILGGMPSEVLLCNFSHDRRFEEKLNFPYCTQSRNKLNEEKLEFLNWCRNFIFAIINA